MEKRQNLREILDVYLRNWLWFVLAAVIALALAYVKLRYSTPKYQLNAKIQVVEEKNSVSELSVLQDLNVFSGKGNTEMSDEIELLKSRDNFIKVVQKLKLNITYEVLGSVRNTEIYPNYPIAINFLSADSIQNKGRFSFYIKILDENEFTYAVEEDVAEKKITFGTNIDTDIIGDIIITPEKKFLKNYIGKNIMVTIDPVPFVAEIYRSNVEVVTIDEFSRIMDIWLKDAIPQRGIDVLNSLVAQNNDNEVLDKKTIADRTSQFINERIADIYTNLSSVDETAESFKESRGIADLATQSSVNFQQSAASESELQNANIQLNIASSMQNMLAEQGGYEIIPNVGLADASIDNAAVRYNELVAQRNRLLESSNEKNPVIVKLDQQLESLKRGMQSSLNNVTNNLNLRVNSLSKQLSQINSRIYAAPGAERALRDISRKQQTTEALYVYLLQKREEAQIAFASAAPKSKIVDNAYLASPFPVEPKRKITYLAALILGLMIPFSIIYVGDLLDNKVDNMVTLQKLIGGNLAVLAEIPKVKSANKPLLVKKDDRSVFAESLRVLRTNLDYILKTDKKRGGSNVVMVTSSVSGEGKTFLSSNLSMILSSTGKRVLLLGGDIRNPKVFDFIKSKGIADKSQIKYGLTDYLFKNELRTKDLIHRFNVNDVTMDIIYSGKIPPNPSELLLSDRLEELFTGLREKYDYVIVDSAPLLSVTDSLILEKYTDHVIYVTKSKNTERKVLEFPLKLNKEGKLKNLSFIVNGVKESNLGYGGKYGYGYGKTVKKWWSFG
ncbi:GumC family protein [Flagellimonas onchidii]|uniref:GumC family protein n=1 Tax=Flagellimonas onchidii TaxID=2562684 RepID=UPI0010A61013|nr:polysaccharide biosynthesis tyrosine autokinase [Allomuricauda onchidii]